MSFNPLDNVLQSLTRQPGWESYRRYCQAIEGWKRVVSPRLLDRTRPVSLRDDVLSVATRSAALAQELSLQRYSLVRKMNPFLDEPIEDIHFSSARWFDLPPVPPDDAIEPAPIDEHPSYSAGENGSEKKAKNVHLSKEGFERLREKIDRRSRNWPLCPRCQSPSPNGEIDRWGHCAFCFARENASVR
jgi:predicted nucleic acid-binding Zn ribbon protein